MSETDQGQPKQFFLVTLVILLFVIVCAQAWHLLNMEQQLHALNNQQSAPELQAEATAELTVSETTTLPTEESISESVGLVENVTIEDTSTNDEQSQIEDEQAAESAKPDKYDIYNSPLYGWTSDPYEEIRRMQQYMDRAFNQRYGLTDGRKDYRHHFRQRISAPKIDVREDSNRYMVYVNIPGTDEDNISVNLDGQQLTIKARQRYEKREGNPSENYVYRERSSGHFQRSILLREAIIPNGMKSRLENGVLKIMIPKMKR